MDSPTSFVRSGAPCKSAVRSPPSWPSRKLCSKTMGSALAFSRHRSACWWRLSCFFWSGFCGRSGHRRLSLQARGASHSWETHCSCVAISGWLLANGRKNTVFPLALCVAVAGLRFKLDENMPGSAGSLLRSAGHEVDTVVDEQLAGAIDADVYRTAQMDQPQVTQPMRKRLDGMFIWP